MEEFNQFLDAMTMEELEVFHLHVTERVALKECRGKKKQERILRVTGELKSKASPVPMNLGIVRARVGSTTIIGCLSVYKSIKPESMLFV